MSLKQPKPNRKRKIPYWLISRFYDDLWPRRPNAWRSARRLLLGPVFKRSQSVCDLGCDTGTNSIEFAHLGSEGIREWIQYGSPAGAAKSLSR